MQPAVALECLVRVRVRVRVRARVRVRMRVRVRVRVRVRALECLRDGDAALLAERRVGEP